MRRFILFSIAIIVLLFASILYLNSAFAYEFDDWGDEEVATSDDILYGEPMSVVRMDGEFLDGDILKISVLVEDIISPILGIAFHLEYEAKKITFLRYDPGDFLERGGDPFYLVKNDGEKNKIIFGETLRRDDSFPLGGGKVVDFYFQIVDGDKFQLKFQNGVISTLDTIRQDIDKINWEDLFLDKNKRNPKVGSFGGESSVLDSVKFGSGSSGFYSGFGVLGVSFLVIIASLSIFLIKKRHERSVNFK